MRGDVHGTRVGSVLPAEVFALRSLTARSGAVLPAEVSSVGGGVSGGAVLPAELPSSGGGGGSGGVCRCGAPHRSRVRVGAPLREGFYFTLEQCLFSII